MSSVFPITDDPRYRRYTASAGQTAFSIPFPFLQDDDVSICLQTAPTEYLIFDPSEYTLSGANDPQGGAVTLDVGRAAGDIILVLGAAILDRMSSIVRDGRFSSGLIDSELDRIRIIEQEFRRDNRRAVKSDYGSDGLTLDPAIADGDTIMREGNRLVAGPNLPDLANDLIAEASEEADRAKSEADRSDLQANRSRSEADRAAGYVNDIVSEKEVPITGTRDGMQSIVFRAGLNSIETRGFYVMGVGASHYVRVPTEPSHGLKVRSLDRFLPNGAVDAANGGWWEIAVPILFAEMAGVVADGLTDDRAAIDRAFRYIEAKGGGVIVFPPRVSRMSGGVGWCDGLKLMGTPGKTKFRLDFGLSTEMFSNLRQYDGVPIEDLTIDGIIFDAGAAGTEAFAASAVTVNGYRRLRISRCVFENATGYGLGLQAKPAGSTIGGPQDECWLEDLVFRHNGHNATPDQHDGLDMKSANKLWAKNCVAYGNGDKGLDFRGVHVHVEDCAAYDNSTFGISIQSGPLASGGTAAYCSLRGLEAFGNGARGIQIAMDNVPSGEEDSVIVLDDVKSYENSLDGVIVYDPFGVSKFRLVASNIHCWDNGNHGFNDSSAGGTITLVGGRFEGNAWTGAVTVGVGRTFVGCHFLRNGTVGFDEALAAANNKLIGCHFDGNVAGVTSLNSSGDTELVGCTGVPGALILGRHAANWVNRWRMEGRSAGGGPRLVPEGTDANIEASISSKGSGPVRVFSGAFGQEISRFDVPTSGTTAMMVFVHDGVVQSLRRMKVGNGGTGPGGVGRALYVDN